VPKRSVRILVAVFAGLCFPAVVLGQQGGSGSVPVQQQTPIVTSSSTAPAPTANGHNAQAAAVAAAKRDAGSSSVGVLPEMGPVSVTMTDAGLVATFGDAGTTSTSTGFTIESILASKPGLTLATPVAVCPDYVTTSKASVFGNFTSTNGGSSTTTTCMSKVYERPIGTPMECGRVKDGKDYVQTVKSGALCYKPCKSGYTLVAGVCWEECPSGYKDNGAFCGKPSSYGRGAGYPAWHEDKCKKESSQGCEKWGAMWYPKCKANFHNVGANVCSPDCPDGMTDTGAVCNKRSYTNPVAATLTTCPSGKHVEAELCYEKCWPGYKGVGNRCFHQSN